MRITVGLLALFLVGADGPPKGPAPSHLSFEVCLVEMKGVDWRAAVHENLQPVTRQGSATIWTAPAEVGAIIRQKAGRVLMWPKLAASSGQTAHVAQRANRNIVADYERVADGPLNHASTVAWIPKVETTREGMTATVTGRKLDQGILTKVVLEDTWVGSVHRVGLTEAQEPGKPGPDAKRWEKSRVEFLVPEITHSEIAGEWLIPNEGMLVVSLGVHTTADESGKAVVHERVALLQASGGAPASNHAYIHGEEDGKKSVGVISQVSRPTALGPTPFAISGLPMPAPVMPSRSLPQPIDTDGQPVALPPLPDDASAAPPTALPESSEPCATPQFRRPLAEPLPEAPSDVPSAAPAPTDRASKRAGYSDDDCPADDSVPPPTVPPTSGTPGTAPATISGSTAPAATGTPFTFRLPINGGISLEVRAVATKNAAVEHAPRPRNWTPVPR